MSDSDLMFWHDIAFKCQDNLALAKRILETIAIKLNGFDAHKGILEDIIGKLDLFLEEVD